jgi:3-(3-hydroxy-phenyl)propionate hydroxylase
MTQTPFDADVAIIGYGPTGVAAANFLGNLGVKVIAFEREKDIYQRARAVTVNDWTLRCFQAAGLDQALLKDMDPHTQYRWKTYAGKELMRIAVQPSTLGQPAAMAIYQPVMEQTLRDGAARFADHVEVRFGQSVSKTMPAQPLPPAPTRFACATFWPATADRAERASSWVSSCWATRSIPAGS